MSFSCRRCANRRSPDLLPKVVLASTLLDAFTRCKSRKSIRSHRYPRKMHTSRKQPITLAMIVVQLLFRQDGLSNQDITLTQLVPQVRFSLVPGSRVDRSHTGDAQHTPQLSKYAVIPLVPSMTARPLRSIDNGSRSETVSACSRSLARSRRKVECGCSLVPPEACVVLPE